MNRFFALLLMTTISNFALAQGYIAHRGASHLAPENTVAAAKLAWEQNADAVELDIYLTKDNRIMVMHDKNTKRTTGKSMVISESCSDSLRMLDAGSFKDAKYAGERIPFLEEMIAATPEGKQLVIELKCGTEVLPALKDVVAKSGKQSQCLFIAFDWNTIVDTKKQLPHNACYWLSSKKEGLSEKMKAAKAAGLDGLDLGYKAIDEQVMQQAKELGLDILAWTVDDPAEAKRLTSLGVKGITTNRPGWLKENAK
ncbi:glycerophosphodiester phosphodiesterase [uncultured Acetobacteroides sp.]|uniref:glycerophosphodiester phosphodiesterase n=1 Tax=uncultured Acetobacteroides sp. TaxID=1760811 RepID=UPI0029F5B082|nr:glycerophosphodiester phosphodiesterase [uncultured Acetobacteroides sp.]